MNSTNTRRTVFLPVLLVAIAATVILRTVALLTSYDFSTNYFGAKTLITVANSLVAGFCVLFFTVIFTVRKDERLIASFSTPATYVPVGILSSAFIFAVFKLALGLVNRTSEAFKVQGKHMLLAETALVVLGIFAIVHFIMTAILTEASSALRAGLGLCAVSFLALYAAYLYFSAELPINSPNKIVDQMAYLFAAVFILYEVRISLGREIWGAYVTFGLISALLTAYSAIPSLICYFAKGQTVSNSIYETALTLALFIFILARLALALGLPKDKESEFIARLKESADGRDAEILAKRGSDYCKVFDNCAAKEEENADTDATSGEDACDEAAHTAEVTSEETAVGDGSSEDSGKDRALDEKGVHDGIAEGATDTEG